ncbi:MAG: response regulator transcription factor [Saprospiraceae bacterium]|nr:response regulator transcription factor [Saprospiraceae bacterium]
MSNIKCIVIEDEPLAMKVLIEYIGQVPFLELEGSFRNALLAIEFLRENKTDLIFLDLHLPKLKGIDFLKTLVHPPAVIFTTAYHQYALQSYDLNVTDYLLKPFSFERFLVAVNKVKITRQDGSETDDAPTRKDYIFLNVQKKKVKILYSDILYIESQREYIKIVTIKNQFTSKLSTHEMESLLPEKLFKRIHRSFIISTTKVESYTSEQVEINGISIPIGREYRGIMENL